VFKPSPGAWPFAPSVEPDRLVAVIPFGDVLSVGSRMSMMAPTTVSASVEAAIERALRFLLSYQAPDGHWVGEAEANSSITSEYLSSCHLTERVDQERERKMVNYLRQRHLPDGGFNLYESGPANVSTTIKAYFAMKVAGVSPDDPALVRAR